MGGSSLRGSFAHVGPEAGPGSLQPPHRGSLEGERLHEGSVPRKGGFLGKPPQEGWIPLPFVPCLPFLLPSLDAPPSIGRALNAGHSTHPAKCCSQRRSRGWTPRGPPAQSGNLRLVPGHGLKGGHSPLGHPPGFPQGVSRWVPVSWRTTCFSRMKMPGSAGLQKEGLR